MNFPKAYWPMIVGMTAVVAIIVALVWLDPFNWSSNDDTIPVAALKDDLDTDGNGIGDDPNNSNGGNTLAMGCGPDKNVGAVQNELGLSVVCLGTEYDAYTWRSVPIKVDANCPDGWICTLHLSNDKIVVTETPGKYEIVAGTFRRVNGYPAEDAVHNACELLTKEQVFGASQTPSFPVVAHNFTCDGESVVAIDQAPVLGDQPSSVCPTSPDQASSLIGGNGWSALPNTDNTGWKYGPGAASVTLTAPDFGRLDAPNGTFRNGQTTAASEATFWCTG